MISVEIALLVFTVYNAALYLLWCWRERLIREMRRLHAKQLAEVHQSWMGAVGRIAAERDAYRGRCLVLMGEHEEVES